ERLDHLAAAERTEVPALELVRRIVRIFRRQLYEVSSLRLRLLQYVLGLGLRRGLFLVGRTCRYRDQNVARAQLVGMDEARTGVSLVVVLDFLVGRGVL